MISELGYTAGWFDSSIHDFLDELPRAFPSIQIALITCSIGQVVPWIKQTSCSLGLGDGTDLNVTAKVHGLIRDLMAHSVSQPASRS
jgi:hypothetical protein